MQIELPVSVESAAAGDPLAPVGSLLRSEAGGATFVGIVGDSVVRAESADVGPDLRFSSGVSALAMSADGLLLAAAVGDTVEVRDVHSGDLWRVFRGGTARITAVTWDDTGKRILGTTEDGRTLGWASERAVPTTNDSSLWIMDADRNDATGDVFVLARDGTVQRMSGRDGSLQQTWQVPAGIASRIAAKDHTVLVVDAAGDTNDLQALDVGSGTVTVVASDGCTTRDVTVSAKGELALACMEGVGVAKSVGAELQVAPLIDADYIDAVVWTPSGVVASSTRGELWGKTQSGELLPTAGCFGAARQLAAVPDSAVVFNAGSGFAPNCAYRYEGVGARDATQEKVLPEADGRSAQAVAASTDGKMVAYGFSNGRVVIMDVATGASLYTTTVGGGSVRGLAFNDDGSAVFVASRYGQFHMIDVSIASQPTEELLATVRSRVDDTTRLGLYERPERMTESIASAEPKLS